MLKKIYALLLLPCIFLTSCTLVLKSLAHAVVKNYDKYTNTDLSNLKLIDSTGYQHSYSDLFAGKTVYLYVLKDKSMKAPDDKDKKYHALKERFSKYPDVTFRTLSLCKDGGPKPDSYNLVSDSSSAQFGSVLRLTEAAPFIIGKDGKMLAYKGPKPKDDLLVDYVLFEARNGVNGTESAGKLISEVNKNGKFKSRQLREWYSKHFNKSADSFDFSFSSTN